MKPWSRLEWLIPLIFAALVILFYWRILTPNLADRQSFPPGDFSHQFWAFAAFEARELSAGRLPLWNPYTFAGAPFWADVQSAVFYPPSLLTIFLVAPWRFSLFALEVEAVAHFWLAAIFMYLFIRQITHSRAAAFIAALTFTFSGYLTGYPSQQLAVLEADVWLPLILFFLYRAHQTRLKGRRAEAIPPNVDRGPKTGDRRPGTGDRRPKTGDRESTESKGASNFPISPDVDRRPETEDRGLVEAKRSPNLPISNLQSPISQPPNHLTSQSPITNYYPPSPIPSLIFAGIAWGMSLLAGHPQSALIVAYISIAYFLFLRLTNGSEIKDQEINKALQNTTPPLPLASLPPFLRYALRPTSYVLRPTSYVLRPTSYVLLPLLTGLGLAAVQFIPAVEYTLLSVRAEGTYAEMSGGFPLIDVIQFLLPGQVSLYSPLYIGVAPLILGIWVILTRPNRHIMFWAVVAFVALLISFGGNTFLYSSLYLTTPGFSIFRGQERWAFAVAFSLCVVVGYATQRLLKYVANNNSQLSTNKTPEETPPLQPSRLPITNYQLPITLTTALLFFALLLTFLCFYGLNDAGWTPDNPFFDLLGRAVFLTILLLLTWLLWKLLAAIPMPPALAAGLLAALICFDLFTINWRTNLFPEQPAWHTRTPDAAAAIKADAAESPAEPYRVYNEFRLYDNYGVPFEIEDLWGASPLRPDRYDKFLAPPTPIERTWELLNVKYVITWRQDLFVPSTIIHEEPAADGVTYVHRLDDPGPRAWLVAQAAIAADETILQTIADPAFDRWQTALLEPDAAAVLEQFDIPQHSIETSNNNPTPPHNTHYALRNTHYAPQSLTIQVESPTPALLILSESHYPGWQATVDGQPAPLLRAYYVLRAVPIPAGRHTVHLFFRPPSFMAGAMMSALTLLLIGVTLFFCYRRGFSVLGNYIDKKLSILSCKLIRKGPILDFRFAISLACLWRDWMFAQRGSGSPNPKSKI